jgi:hypothetical protein
MLQRRTHGASVVGMELKFPRLLWLEKPLCAVFLQMVDANGNV